MYTLRDYGLSSLCKSGLRSSGVLSGLVWQLVTDVSKQPNDLTVEGQADQEG